MLWGGELLRMHGSVCERLGHLAPLAMPGGDAAARAPWRMAAAALHALGRGDEIVARLAQPDAARIAHLLQKQWHAPPTTACGRLFDRSEEHTSELQSLMRISYAVFCLKKKNYRKTIISIIQQ